ncbi:hypothetical protein NDU88_002528 [Pleurodeles waltl]|uniref:Reverse transcriptase domain-containing protein n=1 Tax=Pleurodeles waltl TaxID=8319 RepID=A0AAV7TKW4_PLEWA|nr:hypothetical protein NDU88_002528 [Pleurodeles waltl]
MEDVHLPESQCSFREGRGAVDMISAARQLQENCQEQNRYLYRTFVDLTKACDILSREVLWRIMDKFGYPGKFISMVHQLHNGMLAQVLGNGDSSNDFPVINGVKQGRVLAPTLFSMMFSDLLLDAFCDDEEASIQIRYRTDGRLLNLQRLQAKTKLKVDSVHDFLFTDNCALNAATEAQMQQNINRFPLPGGILASQSVPKRLRTCISPHRRRCIQNQLLSLKEKS